MQRHDQRTTPRRTASHYKPRRWAAIETHSPPLHHETLSSSAATGAPLAFGRFLMLTRRRELLADGVPVEIGSRAPP